MICPWCMHYGAEDDEYLFDEELYCGICAQQMPQSPEGWVEAFRLMDAALLTSVEEELNRIAVSKSGMQPALVRAMGEGLAAIGDLRRSDPERTLKLPESEYARWVEFACTYFAPHLR